LIVKKKIDGALLKLFTKDYQPFRVVEDEGYKEFVKLLNPNYILPNKHSISKTYNQFYIKNVLLK
jgi:hypothetical protein